MVRKHQTWNLEIPRCAIAHLRFALRAPRNDGEGAREHVPDDSLRDAIHLTPRGKMDCFRLRSSSFAKFWIATSEIK